MYFSFKKPQIIEYNNLESIKINYSCIYNLIYEYKKEFDTFSYLYL